MPKSTFPVFTVTGESAGTIARPDIFQVEPNIPLVHRYYTWVRTVLRDSISHTKTRAEVSGGGKKPWKQKGTGRARVGSTRNPVWRHGGIVFGPRKDRNWATRMNRAERRAAFLSALSSLADSVRVLEGYATDAPKTKEVTALIDKLGFATAKKVLHVHTNYDPTTFAAGRNLEKLTNRTVSYLNIEDLLTADGIVITKDALEALVTRFGGSDAK
jgi:large subunit ribosomal protein L4